MTTPLTVKTKVKFGRTGPRGRGEIAAAPTTTLVLPTTRVPRVARLMALAIRLDELIRTGAVRDQAEVAHVGRVTRARVTQIMNLVLLAPDVQEQMLFLKRPERGIAGIILADLKSIACQANWQKQRKMWAKILKSAASKEATASKDLSY